MARVLLAFRADVLHLGVERGYRDSTRLLLEVGADVNAQDSGGRMPLHLAAEKGHRDI